MQQRLQHWTFPFIWVAGTASSLSPVIAQAQVLPAIDGTGTTVVEAGNLLEISGGTQAGQNLFHSFETFNLEQSQSANFLSGSDVFNIVGRISGVSPSYIDGRLQVQGSSANLYLINPAGLLFGPNAQLSLAGSFTATTADQVGFGDAWLNTLASENDYSALSAKPSAFRFSAERASALVNEGNLAVAPGQSLTLIGGEVVNTGKLQAPGGEVGLIAVGSPQTLSFAIPGSLLSLEVDAAAHSTWLAQGESQAFQPTTLPALLTGRPAQGASTLLVNPDGSVTLGSSALADAPGRLAVSGEISVGTGSAVDDSREKVGGTVALLGETVALVDSQVDASGDRGGRIRVGGDVRGQGMLPTARQVLMNDSSQVKAEGAVGEGGNIVLWADDTLTAQGVLSARGATQGGFVETSAHQLNVAGLTVDAGGATGAGTWLVDPVDLTIVRGAAGSNQIDPTAIAATLDGGTNVSLTTTLGTGGNGDIFLRDSIQQLGGGNASLSLQGRRFSTAGTGSTINLTSSGGLTFGLNQVSPEGNPTSDSIAEAVAAIGDVSGRRLVSLGAGRYDFSAPVVLDTDLEIQGAGLASTVLNAVSGNRIFNVLPGSTVALREMTLSATRSAGEIGGGVESRGNLTVESSRFINNGASVGGAINSYASDASLSVLNSEFVDNESLTTGGALSFSDGSDGVIKSSVITGNRSNGDGGGLFASGNVTLDMEGVVFSQNRAGAGGGAINLADSSTLSAYGNSQFIDNQAVNAGGAIRVNTNSVVRAQDLLFEGNSAGSSGGAIRVLNNSTVELSSSELTGNSSASRGGAIHLSQGVAHLSNGTLLQGNVSGEGGGIFASQGEVSVLSGSRVADNQATTGRGGGALVANSVLTSSNAAFTGNSAASDGGGFALDNSTANLGAETRIANNVSSGRGGAVAALSGSAIAASGVTVQGNRAGGSGGGFSLMGASATIGGNSWFENNQSAVDGGGLAAQGASSLTVSDSRFLNNQADDDGGGLYLTDGSTATLEAIQSNGNRAGDYGGGLYLSFGSSATVNGGTLNNNTAREGAGITLRNSTVTVTGNTLVSNNQATENGGGIAQVAGRLALLGAELRQNRAGGDGGGLSITENASTTMDNRVLLINNSAAGNGGGLATDAVGPLTIARSFWSSNRADGSGGSLYKNSAADLTVTASTFQESSAGIDGGGLSLNGGGTAAVTSSTVQRNQAAADGGGLHVSGGGEVAIASIAVLDNQASDQGGGVYQGVGSGLSVTNATIAGNRATREGGAIMQAAESGSLTVERVTLSENSAGVRGGAIAVIGNSPVNISSSAFDSNVADTQDGGAVFAAGESAVAISNSNFTTNQSGRNGGAIALSDRSRLSLSDSAIIGNRAGTGYGGGLAAVGENNVTVTGQLVTDETGRATAGTMKFEGNQAGQDGGGIVTLDNASLTANGVLFRSNTAGDDGGGLAIIENSHGTVIGSNFEQNQAAGEGGGAYSNNYGVNALSGHKATFVESRFLDNQAAGSGGGFHQGIGSSAAIRDSQFGGNQAGANGGGLFSQSALDLVNVEASQNVATQGGGLFLKDSPASLEAVLAADNRANIGGGLMTLAADVTVRNSQFQRNQAAGDGGGIRFSGGSATIEATEFVGNQAQFGAGLEMSDQGIVTLTQSSFTGNQASNLGGAIQVDDRTQLMANTVTLAANGAAYGGALSNRGQSELVNVTLSGNQASREGGGIYNLGGLDVRHGTITLNQAASGGGIAARGTQPVQLTHSIVAANTGSSGTDVSGSFADGGHNLIGQTDGASGFTRSTLLGTAANPLDPQLNALADNGGLSQTHLPRFTSAAIDGGSAQALAPQDQRGSARPVGAAADIGAVELDAAELAAAQQALAEQLAAQQAEAQAAAAQAAQQAADELATKQQAAAELAARPSISGAEAGLMASSQIGVVPPQTRRDHSADNVAIRRLEQVFGQSFEDYWDLSRGPDMSFDEVQAILRRAQEEYQVNSAVIYAVFVSEKDSQSDAILQVEPAPAGDDRLTLALVMPEGELARYQLPVTRAQAEQQVRLLRAAVSDPDDNAGYRPLTQQLYQWLLAPLEKDLAAQGIQNLMYALDAGLRTAPIAAMHDSAGYALERYGISVVPSMGLMQADFPVPVRRSTLAMGVAEFQEESPLPAVPLELEMVKSTVPVSQTVLNEGTTLVALETLKAMEQPGILHLATHATFDYQSPESSYIHLWDNALSMGEFSRLDWRESNLELLILSACSTALSSYNAELGFAGLAAAAGVDATVGSLWQVSDMGTLALMSEFYAQLESTDLRFEALRQAQLSLLQGETRIEDGKLLTSRGAIALPDSWDLPAMATLEHPFFWSAFTMVGNPW